MTALELAVRFGKTLIIQEMDGVEPVLYPLLRRDLIAQGAHKIPFYSEGHQGSAACDCYCHSRVLPFSPNCNMHLVLSQPLPAPPGGSSARALRCTR